MKKFLSIAIAAVAAAFMMVSCQNELGTESAPLDLKTITIAVSTPDAAAVKGTLDGLSVVWSEGEAIAVYDGVSADPRQFTVLSVNGSEATISGEIAAEATDLTAVYPYAAAAGFAEGKLSVTVPGNQVIPAGQPIDPSALVSVASAALGEDLLFKNVTSLIKFTVGAEGATSVQFKGNASEKFFGTASVDPSTMEITGASAAAGMVSAAAGSSFVKDAVYYASCFPCEFATGMNVCTSMADKKYYKSSDKANEFVRNSGLNMGDLATGTELPMVITNKAELDAWAAHSGCYLDGETVKLGADINYAGEEWKALPQYAANFDGQGNSIYNIKMVVNPDGESSCLGFFSVLRHSNTVKDLVLGMDPATTAYDGTSTIDIISTQYNGAVAALIKADVGTETVTISGCRNYIPLIRQASATKTEGLRIGGIVGAISEASHGLTTISGCTNYGSIDNLSTTKNNTSYYAGIIGYSGAAELKITSCINEGTVCLCGKGQIGGASFGAGMLGRLVEGAKCTIENCTNKGKIYTRGNVKGAMPYLAGILGADKADNGLYSEVKIENCSNEGLISAYNQSKGSIAGGIVALIQSWTEVTDCENSGEIFKAGNHASTSIFGGIAGKTEQIDGASITGCTNTGKVYEKEQTGQNIIVFGGIAGTCQIPVSGCANKGNIVAEGSTDGIKEYLGGIAGLHCSTSLTGGSSAIEDCTVDCTIRANSKVAGVASMGGMIGCQGQDACSTGKGCSITCTVKTPYVDMTSTSGLLVGKYAAATTATTFGTADSKVKVAGSVCGTAVTADNVATLLEGSATANEAHVFNVELL